MKLAILSLVLLACQLTFGQDIESILNPSLRLMDNLHNASSPMSCFDYPQSIPSIAGTRKGPKCKNTFEQVPVNQFREMKREGYRSGNYILSRIGEKKYQAILNMNFVPDLSPHSGSAGTPALARQLLQRTRNCLAEMKPYLKGPQGEELEFVLVTGNDPLPENMPRPQAVTVKVSNQASNYRGDANNFGSNFECTTIGHEMLHHLGLCDEYHEGQIHVPGYAPADWSCRPVTAKPSYMRNMHYAFQTTLPLTSRCECDERCQNIMNKGGKAKEIFLSMNGSEILNTESSLVAGSATERLCTIVKTENVPDGEVPDKAFALHSENGNNFVFHSYRANTGHNNSIFYDRTIYNCACRPDRPYCHKMMQQLKSVAANVPKRATCPDGLRPNATAPSIGTDSGGSRVDECRDVGDKRICDLVITTSGNGQSLISPSHFYKMIAGNCAGGSPNYERCERYAYIGKNSSACAQMPPECMNDDFYLNGPQGPVPAPASNQ